MFVHKIQMYVRVPVRACGFLCSSEVMTAPSICESTSVVFFPEAHDE